MQLLDNNAAPSDEVVVAKQGIEAWARVAALKQQWGASCPLDMTIMEFAGNGDPAFGGSADDRALMQDGRIRSRSSSADAPAVFATIEAAHIAARGLGGRRPGSVLGVVPRWS